MNTGAIDLAKQSDSTIIILIVVIVCAIIALKPVMKMWVAAKDKQQQREIDQQYKLMEVITNNTEVNVALKTLLEEDRRNCVDCRKDQLRMFGQIQDNQDVANMKLTEIHTILMKDN
jgi:Na+-transporting NADH:ubiquinone oxidoreductase subunit NqrC